MKLGTGTHAPDFTATACFGEGRCDWKLSEQLKKAPAMLVFYSRDFESISTARLCALRDHWDLLKRAGTQLVAISSSDEYTHDLFVKAYDLPFPLLADPQKSLIRSFRMPSIGIPFIGRVLIGRDLRVHCLTRHILPFRGPTVTDTLAMMENSRA